MRIYQYNKLIYKSNIITFIIKRKCIQFLNFAHNGLWYGVVRDFEAISYQFTLTFFTSHEPWQTSETRMHYTMC